MVNVTLDPATVRERVGLMSTGDSAIGDSDVQKYITEATEYLSDQVGASIDKTSATEAEAEAIRNLAAIKCYFKATGTSSTGWTANFGPVTFSGAPGKVAMVNWLWDRVHDFIESRMRRGTTAFKVATANY